jgi:predicted MFS family arabinose efflux permease
MSSKAIAVELRIAVSVIGALGLQFFAAGAIPLLLGSVTDQLNLTASQAGLLGTLELSGVAIAATATAPIVARQSRVLIAMLGCVLAAVGQLTAMLAETLAILSFSRVVAGAGMGIAAAAAQAAISASTQPDRLFGIFFAAFTPLGALLLLALPHLIAAGGYEAGYALLAAISLAAIPFSIWLPPPPIAVENRNVPLGSAPHRAAAMPALLAVTLIAASDLGMWTFIERIGSRAGLAQQDVGEALAVATLAGSASAAIAAWLGTRVGRMIPVVVSIGSMVVVAVLLASSTSAATYFRLVMVWSASVFVAYTYALGALAAADVNGRWSAAAAGARSAGGAIGPFAAGLVVTSDGYEIAGLLVGAWCALALVLSVPLAAQLSRHPTVTA